MVSRKCLKKTDLENFRSESFSIRTSFFLFFIEKLRQLTHVVGTLSHKGIARRALPASGVKGVDGGE